MNHISTAQMTLTLGALLCHDMSHMRALALVTARTRTLEPLCGSRHGLLLVGHCLTPKYIEAKPRVKVTGGVVVSVRQRGVIIGVLLRQAEHLKSFLAQLP